MTQLYRIARDMQSRFGFLLEAKVGVQRLVRQTLRKPFEAEFALLDAIDLAGRPILDIGANRGQSIDAIRLYQPSAKIIAFEPNPLLAQKLKARFGGDPNTDIRVHGLSAEALSSDLFVPHYRGFMYDGLASFDEQEARGWLNAETVWNFDPSKLRIEKCTCDLKRLDDLNLAPKVLKIDVQGFESHVLQGGRETLARHRPLIILENNPDADRLLKDWGWAAFGYENARLHPGKQGLNNTIYLHTGTTEFDHLKQS